MTADVRVAQRAESWADSKAGCSAESWAEWRAGEMAGPRDRRKAARKVEWRAA